LKPENLASLILVVGFESAISPTHSKEAAVEPECKRVDEAEAAVKSSRYGGHLWLDKDGTANFKFHIAGGDFATARSALEKFIQCLQDKLNRGMDCPYADRVMNHCGQCGKDFEYAYESDVCPSCFSNPLPSVGQYVQQVSRRRTQTPRTNRGYPQHEARKPSE
jgi:rRNA maturation endonuclease Nob1